MLHIEPRHPAPIEIHKSSASDRSVRSMAQRAKDTLSPCAKQQEKNAENATGLSVRKMMPILKLALEMTHTPIDDVMGRPIAKDFALPGGKTRRMT